MNKIAFIFPGQGSQSVGMLAQLASQYPDVLTTFAVASDVLGYDLWQLVQQGPAEQLNQTQYTQPALLAADISLWRICQQQGITAAVLAGHSLGEYAALVAAEVIRYEEAIAVVAKRGEFMQQATPPEQGAMAAIIGLSDAIVAEVCVTAAEGDILAPANFNAIGQVVIAGEHAAVDRALVIAKSRGAKLAKLITVSVPSHCALMKPAAEQLSRVLDSLEFNVPKVPIIHNVDAEQHSDPERIKQALIAQLAQPVRWVASMQAMVAADVSHMVECGPGKVLAGLMKRINKEIAVLSVDAVIKGEE